MFLNDSIYNHQAGLLELHDGAIFNASSKEFKDGSVYLEDVSTFKVANNLDTNQVSFSADTTNNNLIIDNDSTLKILSGTINEETVVTIADGSTLKIDDATIFIDDKENSKDDWQGTIELLQDNSTIKFQDFKSQVGKLVADRGNVHLLGQTYLTMSDGDIAEIVSRKKINDFFNEFNRSYTAECNRGKHCSFKIFINKGRRRL